MLKCVTTGPPRLRGPACPDTRHPVLLRARPSHPGGQGSPEAATHQDPGRRSFRTADHPAAPVDEEAQQKEVHEIWICLRPPGGLRETDHEREDYEKVEIVVHQQ